MPLVENVFPDKTNNILSKKTWTILYFIKIMFHNLINQFQKLQKPQYIDFHNQP